MNKAQRQIFWPSVFSMLDLHPICLYDGILNNGDSHTGNSNAWKNIGTGGSQFDAIRNFDTDSTKSLWADTAALFTDRTSPLQTFFIGGRGSRELHNYLGSTWTVGAAYMPEAGWKANYSGVVGAHNTWNDNVNSGIVLGQYEDGNVDNGCLFSSAVTNYNEFAHPKLKADQILINQLNTIQLSFSPSRRAMFFNGQLYQELKDECPVKYITLHGNPITIGSSCVDENNYQYGTTDRGFVGKIFCVWFCDYVIEDKFCAVIDAYLRSRFAC